MCESVSNVWDKGGNGEMEKREKGEEKRGYRLQAVGEN
jgi:hypothetical protein